MSSIKIVLGLKKVLAGTTAAVVFTTELSAKLISNSAAETVALLVSVPGIAARTTSVRSALLPPARLPRAQLMFPLAFVQLPWLVVDETNVIRLGKTSVSTTPLAAEGPRLVTAITYVRLLPTGTGLGN